MDRVKKETGFEYRTKNLISFLAGILAGSMIGAVLTSALLGYRVDQQHQIIHNLETTNQDQAVRLLKLEEAINQRKIVLKNIEIHIQNPGDDMDHLTLQKSIREKLVSLLGKEVGNIDVELVGEIVDGRILQLDEAEYRLKLKKLILSDVLKIWVEAAEIMDTI